MKCQSPVSSSWGWVGVLCRLGYTPALFPPRSCHLTLVHAPLTSPHGLPCRHPRHHPGVTASASASEDAHRHTCVALIAALYGCPTHGKRRAPCRAIAGTNHSDTAPAGVRRISSGAGGSGRRLGGPAIHLTGSHANRRAGIHELLRHSPYSTVPSGHRLLAERAHRPAYYSGTHTELSGA